MQKTYTEILNELPADEEILNAVTKAFTVVRSHFNILCAVSGGADSDDVVHILQLVKGDDNNITYVFFNTGLETAATKAQIKYLEKRYSITIKELKAVKPIPLCVKEYGVPFLSKQVSEFIERLQRYNFKWEDKPFEELYAEYPKCKAALRWWCNCFEGKGKFNIERNKYLKEFMIQNPPDFPISNKCCHYAKKLVAENEKNAGKYDLSITGVRKAEGGARATAYKSCFSDATMQHRIAEFRPVFWFTKDTKKTFE